MSESRAWSPSVAMGNFKKLADFAGCGETAAPDTNGLLRSYPPGVPGTAGGRSLDVQAVVRRARRGRVNRAGEGKPYTAGEGRTRPTSKRRTPGGHPDAGTTVQCGRPSTAGPVSMVSLSRSRELVVGPESGFQLKISARSLPSVGRGVRASCGCRHAGDGGAQPSVGWLKPPLSAGFGAGSSRLARDRTPPDPHAFG